MSLQADLDNLVATAERKRQEVARLSDLAHRMYWALKTYEPRCDELFPDARDILGIK